MLISDQKVIKQPWITLNFSWIDDPWYYEKMLILPPSSKAVMHVAKLVIVG